MSEDTYRLDQLLARVGRGDRHAYQALYDQAVGAVYGSVRRVLRNSALAEEVAQEVMLELWRLAPRFDPQRGSAAAWIITMARRRAIDRVRSEQAAADRAEALSHLEEATPFDVVSESVIEQDEQARIRARLASLTDLQREAIEMAFVGGRTYREVAEALDLPLGTVKTRIRDGLLRLADAMGVSK